MPKNLITERFQEVSLARQVLCGQYNPASGPLNRAGESSCQSELVSCATARGTLDAPDATSAPGEVVLSFNDDWISIVVFCIVYRVGAGRYSSRRDPPKVLTRRCNRLPMPLELCYPAHVPQVAPTRVYEHIMLTASIR